MAVQHASGCNVCGPKTQMAVSFFFLVLTFVLSGLVDPNFLWGSIPSGIWAGWSTNKCCKEQKPKGGNEESLLESYGDNMSSDEEVPTAIPQRSNEDLVSSSEDEMTVASNPSKNAVIRALMASDKLVDLPVENSGASISTYHGSMVSLENDKPSSIVSLENDKPIVDMARFNKDRHVTMLTHDQWAKAMLLMEEAVFNGPKDGFFKKIKNNIRREVYDKEAEKNTAAHFDKAMTDSWKLRKTFKRSRIQKTIVKLASQIPELFEGGLIPRLVKQEQKTLTFTRKQIAAILSGMVLGLFPNQPREGGGRPNASMDTFLRDDYEKCMCLLAYFESVAELELRHPQVLENEKISFSRNVISKVDVFNPESEDQQVMQAWKEGIQGVMNEWEASDLPLTDVEVLSRNPKDNSFASIEDDQKALQADFANAYIGGGVLNYGCVQEEIRFSVSPELITSMLLSDVMSDNEAIILSGARRFASYSGYMWQFKYVAPHVDPAPVVDSHADVHITAFDALYFDTHRSSPMPPADQYNYELLVRELRKAEVAFAAGPEKGPSFRPIATGNWGCGAFNGDPQLKALLQWLAASKGKRKMRYYIFGDERVNAFRSTVQNLKSQGINTVGKLAKRLFRPGHLHKLKLGDDNTFERVLMNEDAQLPAPQDEPKKKKTLKLLPKRNQ